MTRNPLRRWLRSYLSPRRDDLRTPKRTNLGVERFEDRCLPSVNLPINGATWTPFGPAPLVSGTTAGSLSASGRMDQLASDPTNPNRIFVNTAGGGVWETLNGGNTWKPLTDFLTGPSFGGAGVTSLQSLKMGPIALGHLGAGLPYNTIYAAEGAGDLGTVGHGILKSSDGGATWTLLDNADFDGASF